MPPCLRDAVAGAGRELIDERVMWVAARGAKTQSDEHYGDFAMKVGQDIWRKVGEMTSLIWRLVWRKICRSGLATCGEDFGELMWRYFDVGSIRLGDKFWRR